MFVYIRNIESFNNNFYRIKTQFRKQIGELTYGCQVRDKFRSQQPFCTLAVH